MMTEAGSGQELDAVDQQILKLLAAGATGRVLYRSLNLPPRTTQRRIQALKIRFGVNTTIEAVVVAVRRGLV